MLANFKTFAKNYSQRSRIAEVPEIEFLQLGRGVTFFLTSHYWS